VDVVSVTAQVRPVLNGMRIDCIRAIRVIARVYVFTRDARRGSTRLMPVKVAADTSNLLLCPMPGLVVSIAVAEGQQVKAGETLAVVEAMKMENVLRAERDVTIGRINAKPGESSRSMQSSWSSHRFIIASAAKQSI
jgi:propionyl-CoA carboxylase alpha chain